jgi:hypothetical protein
LTDLKERYGLNRSLAREAHSMFPCRVDKHKGTNTQRKNDAAISPRRARDL